MCTLKNDTLYLCKVIFYILYRNQKFSKNKNPGIVIKQKKTFRVNRNYPESEFLLRIHEVCYNKNYQSVRV